MPATGTSFRDKILPYGPVWVNGLPVLNEGKDEFGNGLAGRFIASTGNPNTPVFGVADVSPSQTSNVTLIPQSAVPRNTRMYLTRVDVDSSGFVNWGVTTPTTGIPYVSIQDTAGAPLLHLPFYALRGGCSIAFPNSDVVAPLTLGPNTVNGPIGTPVTTWTYSATTNLVTAGASVFPASATCMVGVPVSIIDGTGKGQTAIVQTSASNDATHIYLGSSAFPTAPDSTSVLAVWWVPLASYTSTTVMALPNSGTPYVANSLDNGYFLQCIYGSGVGTARLIASNTNAGAVTLATALNTALSATATLNTLSMVTTANCPGLNGAIDMGVAGRPAAAGIGRGLQVVVNTQGGSSPVGSNIRVHVEGFWAA